MQSNLNFSVPSGRAWRQPLMSEHLPSQTQFKHISVYVRVHSWLCSPRGAAPCRYSCRYSLLPGSCRCPGLWEAPWGGVAEQWGGHWQGQVAPAQPGCSGPSREGTRNQRWFFVCSEAASRLTAPSAAVVPSLLPVQHSAIHCCHLSQQ